MLSLAKLLLYSRPQLYDFPQDNSPKASSSQMQQREPAFNGQHVTSFHPIDISDIAIKTLPVLN
jgi:hypothetical protein